jgi:hypothetical protein
MTPPVLYVAITNHGFGHVTRTTAVVDHIQQDCPEAVVIVATTAPRWLLDRQLSRPFIHRPRALDIGVVQGDSFQMDQAATLAQLQDIQRRSRSLIASEVQFLRQNRVRLVLADIPPLAVPIAHGAGVPCWMAGNFGWDFIYRPWGGPFVAIADWIAELFGGCDRLFRLPFHDTMDAFPTITDVGLTGSHPQVDLEDLRRHYALTQPPARTVLLTFGGLGLSQVPYETVEQFPDWIFITFDRRALQLPNLRVITNPAHRPVDLMPLCDRIIAKPGYGTFAEACLTHTAVCTLPREGFAEAPLLLAGIRNHAYHQDIEPTDFFNGDWAFLRTPLQPPRLSQPLDGQGNHAIAEAVVRYLRSA